MSDANPWRALWLRPSSAIDAFSAPPRPLVIAFLAALGGALGFAGLIPLNASAIGASLLAKTALVGALAGLVSLYLEALVVNGLARLFGGAGARRDVRAASALSSLPRLLGFSALLAGFATGLGESDKDQTAWAALLLVATIGALWSATLFVDMLARVQKFGLIRAFFVWIVGAVLLSVGLALCVRIVLFQPFDAPSASMEPTILPGDYFFVSKYAYGYSRFSLPFAPPIQGRLFGVAPGRGDVVVFRKPGSDVDFVKRIIGLPGETIRLSKSRLFINGVEVERTEAAPYRTNSFLGRSVEAPAYIEKLPGGPAHRIIQIEGENGLLGTTGDFVVPPWGYFLLGDNRDNSTDSRVPLEHGGVGAVPFDHLIGRVEMIYYSATPPQDGAPAQVRPERMGTAVE